LWYGNRGTACVRYCIDAETWRSTARQVRHTSISTAEYGAERGQIFPPDSCQVAARFVDGVFSTEQLALTGEDV
jgi:hypothetical protein